MDCTKADATSLWKVLARPLSKYNQDLIEGYCLTEQLIWLAPNVKRYVGDITRCQLHRRILSIIVQNWAGSPGWFTVDVPQSMEVIDVIWHPNARAFMFYSCFYICQCRQLGVKSSTSYPIMLLDTGARPIEVQAMQKVYKYITRVKYMPDRRLLNKLGT
mgnify:CR=1 FL=1